MDWLNYHHLQYFWLTVREGGVSAAGRKLGVSQPTVSGQLRELERRAGGKLYVSRGRRIELTDLGRTVFEYADDIFRLGGELVDVLGGRTPSGARRLLVGVPDVLPKLVAYRLLLPAVDAGNSVQIVVREGPLKDLLGRLSRRELDIVFSDSPPGAVDFRAVHYALGWSGVSLYGTAKLVRRFGPGSSKGFGGLPLLMPREETAIRRSLDRWVSTLSNDIRIVGEFDDTALMKVFAEGGAGFVAAPTVVEDDMFSKFRLKPLCELPGAREEFFAVTVERNARHPSSEIVRTLVEPPDFLYQSDR